MATRLLSCVVGDMVVNFLDAVVKVYEAAVAIHNDHPHDICEIYQLSTNLAVTIEGLHREIIEDDDAGLLPRTCVKLGQHILVRLDQVEAFVKVNGPRADLRIVWPVAAVEALGERIQKLQDQWSLTFP
jgi:hypothetical protein